ncbi:MAG: hypothetical protein QNK11_05625 [Legionella sp.]|nr:hypothetical protein [Legionella sp.]
MMYKLFGLQIDSDVELLAPISDTGVADVVIKQSNQKLLGAFNLNIQNIAVFQIKAGKQIFYTPNHDDVVIADLRLILMGSCMGAILQQRGLIVLHGNAVTWDNQTCNIYMGEKGAGKSTTAAWYYQQGASIVADDICAICLNSEGRPVVLPGIPQLKLWQASADLLNISTTHLKRVRKQLDKFILPIAAQRFANKPCEIKNIFEINQTINQKQDILGLKKLLKLQHHTYRYHFLSQMNLEYIYIKQLMRFANQVKCFEAPRIICEEVCLA